MKKILIMILTGLVLSSCATARLAKGPDTFALLQHSGGVNLGVSKVLDERESKNVGTIGAAGIRVNDEIGPLTTNYLISFLNSKLNANIVRLPDVDKTTVPAIAKQNNVDKVMVARIKRIKMFSMDALMQPVEVDMDLEVTVFDAAGSEIYQQMIQGHYEKRIGLTIVDKSTGELVEAAVKDTVSNLITNRNFQTVLSQQQ